MPSPLSKRALANLHPDPAFELVLRAFYNQYDSETNPGGIVLLAVAENKLMHRELTSYLNAHFKMECHMFTYGTGPSGSPALKTALAKLLNRNFNPNVEVQASSISLLSGVTSVVDSLTFCICEEGDGIMVGRPLYVAFPKDIGERSGAKLIPVALGDVDATSIEAVHRYEIALHEAQGKGVRVRAVILANPHNPLGRAYTREALEGYLSLCSKYDMHLISDEVYALSVFASSDVPLPSPFVSVLSLDLEKFIDPSLVHVLYGMSKDFCSNGLRVGALITQHNPGLLRAFNATSPFAWLSSMADKAWTIILEDEAFLSDYLNLFTSRLAAAYSYCAELLKEHDIPYTPASAGPFVWLDLSRYLSEASLEGEMELGWRMIHGGVFVALGGGFFQEKNGCYRLTFAIPEPEMKLGMDRLIKVLSTATPEGRAEHKSELEEKVEVPNGAPLAGPRTAENPQLQALPNRSKDATGQEGPDVKG